MLIRTHKRECPLSLRKHFPRREHETFPAPSGPVPPSRSPSPKHVPIKEKKPSPTKDISPQMKVGVSRFMGSSPVALSGSLVAAISSTVQKVF